MTAPRRCLSVVMPCYDERATVEQVVDRVLASPWTGELVVVDDGSTDGTAEILDKLAGDRVRVIHHERNLGKGMALRHGGRLAMRRAWDATLAAGDEGVEDAQHAEG